MSAASTTAPATTTTRTASPSPLPATLPEDSATPSCTDGQGACCTTSDLLDASPAEDLAAAFKTPFFRDVLDKHFPGYARPASLR